MNDSIDSNDYQEFLLDSRIEFLISHRNLSLIGHFCIIIMTMVFLWDKTNHTELLIWLAFILVAVGAAFMCLKTPSENLTSAEKTIWLRWRAVISFWVGFSWGIVPVFFFVPDSTTYLIVICCIFTGFISSAISVLFSYAVSFISFAAGITLPFVYRLFSSDGYEHTFIGITIFVYVGVLAYTTLNIQKLFLKSTRSNFDNISLLGQLRVEKEMALRATKAKSHFLAAASHDLRQPIHAVNLFLDVLQPLQPDKKSQGILDKVRQSMRGLNKMLHGLLDISRLDASVVENYPEHISLNNIIHQLIEELNGNTKNLTISNQLVQPIFVFADPTLLERIVRNLFDNAVKYTNQGSISFTAELNEQSVVLAITDTGVGIPQDQLELVFDEFQQLHNPERDRAKGLGLGLAIVKRLCRLADIEILLQSVLNVGTTVTLDIPSGEAKQERAAREVTEFDIEGSTVLVVDDEADILDGMQSLLEQWGCRAVTASSIDDAKLKLSSCGLQPDLLITDYRLRDGQSGTDVITHFKSRYGDQLPAILITGDTSPERVTGAKKSGARVVYKPVEGNALRKVIQELLKL